MKIKPLWRTFRTDLHYRLKTRLDLPDIIPNAPCPQRIYKRVYQYLSSTLANTRTPSKRSYDDANTSPYKYAGTSDPSTPSKRRPGRPANNPSTPTPARHGTAVTPRSTRI